MATECVRVKILSLCLVVTESLYSVVGPYKYSTLPKYAASSSSSTSRLCVTKIIAALLLPQLLAFAPDSASSITQLHAEVRAYFHFYSCHILSRGPSPLFPLLGFCSRCSPC